MTGDGRAGTDSVIQTKIYKLTSWPLFCLSISLPSPVQPELNTTGTASCSARKLFMSKYLDIVSASETALTVVCSSLCVLVRALSHVRMPCGIPDDGDDIFSKPMSDGREGTSLSGWCFFFFF